jgi:hypothetical protein
MDPKTGRIRALNDELRQHLIGGLAVITPGVAALGVACRFFRTFGQATASVCMTCG